jgi:hypothetical protein
MYSLRFEGNCAEIWFGYVFPVVQEDWKRIVFSDLLTAKKPDLSLIMKEVLFQVLDVVRLDVGASDVIVVESHVNPNVPPIAPALPHGFAEHKDWSLAFVGTVMCLSPEDTVAPAIFDVGINPSKKFGLSSGTGEPMLQCLKDGDDKKKWDCVLPFSQFFEPQFQLANGSFRKGFSK